MNIQVPGEGPLDAKIVLIGEAPGGTEERLRRPFVGDAGVFLDKSLANAGITRGTCYVTNVFKERPPGNDVTHFLRFKKNWREEPDYLHDALEHIEYLYEELQGLPDATVFVALGRIPLYILTGLHSILKRRGSILPLHGLNSEGYPGLEGRKVIPVIHPAAALRVFEYRYMIAKDMHRVKGDSEYPELRIPERVLDVDPGYEGAMRSLREIQQSGREGAMIAFDIEVLNKQVSCISLADKPEYSLVVPFLYHYQDYYSAEQEGQLWLVIEEILSDKEIKKVGQNVIFDCSFLLHRYGITVRNVEDTMTAHFVLFPEFPHGLDFLCSTLSREPYYKDEGKETFGSLDIDNQFLKYSAKDSAVLLDIFPRLESLLKQMGNWDTYKRQIGILPQVLFMGERAVFVDQDILNKARKKSDQAQERIQRKLDKVVGQPLNVNSPKQMKEYFYEECKIKPYLLKGKPTTNDDALKRIIRLERKGSDAALLCKELRTIRKMSSSYLEAELNEENRLSGSYKIMGALSGRLASGKTIFNTGVNMQTNPPEMRRNLFADPGYVGFEVDLGQAENRIVAHTGPEPVMKQAFEEGIDLHCLTASRIFGIPLEEVSDIDGSSTIGGGHRSQRYWGKQGNHSLNYNLGYKKFSHRFEIKETVGKKFVDKWHSIYPGVRNNFHQRVKRELEESRTVTNCYGRTRKFFDRWGEELFNDAYAHGPQSTVADKMNILLGRLDTDKTGVFDLLELLNQVHDSIWFQLPLTLGASGIAEVLAAVRSIMEEPVPFKVPFVIPADIMMGYCFYKKSMVEIQDTEESVAMGLEKLGSAYVATKTVI